MRPFLILLFAFFLSTLYCAAQRSPGFDSTVELHLQLIEENSSGQLALDVEITNCSAKDIYIPEINYFRIHLYQQTDSGWTELDLYTQRPHLRGKKWLPDHDNPAIRFVDNHIIDRYHHWTDSFYRAQSLIQKAFEKQNQQVGRLAIFFRPLFLKAGQGIKYYHLISMNFMKKQAGEYRISYANEPGDAKHIDDNEVEMIRYPEIIFGYTRYLPMTIKANTIYYSTVE